MSDTIASKGGAADRECPKCAEMVATEDATCGFCGFPITPRKPFLVRLGEAASLAVALAGIVFICRGLGRLLGV